MVGTDSLTIDHLATPDSVPAIRHEVVRFLDAAGVQEARCEDVALAVAEAAGNVVVHAYRHTAAPGLTSVQARLSDRRLEVTVSDRGCGMRPRTDSPGLGMGLPLITRLASAIDLAETGDGAGVTLHMTFAL